MEYCYRGIAKHPLRNKQSTPPAVPYFGSGYFPFGNGSRNVGNGMQGTSRVAVAVRSY